MESVRMMSFTLLTVLFSLGLAAEEISFSSNFPNELEVSFEITLNNNCTNKSVEDPSSSEASLESQVPLVRPRLAPMHDEGDGDHEELSKNTEHDNGTSWTVSNYRKALKGHKKCLSGKCVWLAGQLLDRMDLNVDPCQDFEKFACGNFQRKSSVSNYRDEIDNDLGERLQVEIMKSWDSPEHPRYVQLARDLYEQCLNATVDPEILMNILEEFGGLPMLENDTMAQNFSWWKANMKARQMGFLVTLFPNVEPVKVDIDRPDFYDNSIGCGLVQPIVWEDEREFFVRLGISEETVERHLRELSEFSLVIDDLHYDNPEGEGSYVNISQLQKEICPNVDWVQYLNSMILFVGDQQELSAHNTIHVGSVNCLKAYCQLLSDTSKALIANYFMAHLVYTFFHRLDTSVPRGTACIGQIHKAIPEALEYIYIKNIFDSRRRDLALEIGQTVRKKAVDIVSESWMDEETIRHVVAKIKSVKYNIGHPDHFLKECRMLNLYKNLTFSPTDEFFVNVHLALKAKFDNKFIEAFDEKSKRNFRGLLDEASHYLHLQNSLFLTARHLENKLFDPEYPDYVNYASVGSTFGHEIVHSFDNKGRKFDLNGKMNGDLWTNYSKTLYESKVSCFVEQYNKFSFNDIAGASVDGSRTLNENIADNVGFTIGYKAYVSGQEAFSNDGLLPGLSFTPRQLYWIILANQGILMSKCS